MKRAKRLFTIAALCALTLLCILPLAACGGAKIDALAVKGKSLYVTGEAFAGATLTVTYTDGKREQVEVTADMTEGFDTSVAGEKTVFVNYGGKSAQFKITVTDLYASSISVSADSVTEYIINTGYTDGDAQIVVSYTDGSAESMPVTSDMITGFDTKVEGKKIVSVKYGALNTSYEIKVRQPYVTSAVVDTERTKTLYRVGNEFDKIVLNVVYENGEQGVVDITDASAVKGFDTSAVGKKSIRVTYRNRTVGLDIEVVKAIKSATLGDADTVYIVGDAFKNAVLNVVYSDDTEGALPVMRDMIEQFDTSKSGSKTVKLDIDGIKLSYDIIVASKFVDNGGANKIQVEDEAYVDMSGAKLQTGAANKLENTASTSAGASVPNGAEGYSTANISVKGNKIVIRFISDTAGKYRLGLRAQSGSNKGLSDQAIADVFAVKVNAAAVTVSGTLGKACTGTTGWKDMTNWTTLDDIAGEIDVIAGLNTIEFEYLQEASTVRCPNIDYFILTAVAE